MSQPLSTRRSWVKPSADYSVRRQCRLAGLPRSSMYYVAVPESEENLAVMWETRDRLRVLSNYGKPGTDYGF